MVGSEGYPGAHGRSEGEETGNVVRVCLDARFDSRFGSWVRMPGWTLGFEAGLDAGFWALVGFDAGFGRDLHIKRRLGTLDLETFVYEK